MATPTKLKVSAIQQPTPANTVLVQQQLKQSVETGQRLRGDPQDSFVQVKELTQGGLWTLVNGVLVPGAIADVGVAIVVADSITGAGTIASPLELSGDSASPGNTQLYGTNSSGTKGWYAQPSSSALTVTDGTHSVANTTNVTFAGAIVSGTSPNATVTISGGGSSGAPATVPDLQYWFQADISAANSTAGNFISGMPNSTPGSTYCPFQVQNGAKRSSTNLNSKTVAVYDGSLNAAYLLPGGGWLLNNVTVFVVYNPATAALGDFVAGSASHALQLRMNASNQLELVCSGIVLIGNATTAFTTGTFAQGNATYAAASGAYAFRMSRAAAGSGTNVQGISTSSVSICYNAQGSTEFLNGALAELIIYNRVLTLTEIQSIEAYLHTKWGV